MPADIFKDRRRQERRRDERGSVSGCRRQGERRRHQGRYNPAPWWLQIDYAEELTPRDVTVELRRHAARQHHRSADRTVATPPSSPVPPHSQPQPPETDLPG